MSPPDAARTVPAPLDRLAGLESAPAWQRFRRRYQPLVRDWCGGRDLRPPEHEEQLERGAAA